LLSLAQKEMSGKERRRPPRHHVGLQSARHWCNEKYSGGLGCDEPSLGQIVGVAAPSGIIE